MTHVTGLGGVFFRAKDTKAVIQWYKDILGIDISGDAMWRQEAGLTVYAPFKTDTDYFGDRGQQFMINFRVNDLDGLIADLKKKGIDVRTDPEWDAMPEIGKFARIHDPAGTPIELWEPGKDCT